MGTDFSNPNNKLKCQSHYIPLTVTFTSDAEMSLRDRSKSGCLAGCAGPELVLRSPGGALLNQRDILRHALCGGPEPRG
jgi:hypothetical protein